MPGYFAGGKTGTAEKWARTATATRRHFNIAAFTQRVPDERAAIRGLHDARRAARVMQATYGYSTAGWVAAPEAGRVIARIGPMLGMMPDTPGRAGDQRRRWPCRWSPAGRRCRGAWAWRAAAGGAEGWRR